MITIPVIYVLGDKTFERTRKFEALPISPIERRETNEATFRAAISNASAPYKEVLQALYRELVLANYAKFDGKSGRLAEMAISRVYPASRLLPNFVRTSERFNASGMILYNLEVQPGTGAGYKILPSLLAALIRGGALDKPRRLVKRSEAKTFAFPEEVSADKITEGAISRITINAYERSVKARQKCLAHHGYDCACCGFNFEHQYGAVGRKLIHVHHIIPIANIGMSYVVDPIRDLVPVCPNCHSIIHKGEPPYTITEIQALLHFAKSRGKLIL